jgi:hypothetical protein
MVCILFTTVFSTADIKSLVAEEQIDERFTETVYEEHY